MKDFFIYIQELELIAFYSSFPLFYFFIQTWSPQISGINIKLLLPRSYAISVLLYLGMKIDQSIGHFDYYVAAENHTGLVFYLQIFTLSGLLFFFSYFKQRHYWVLLHSVIYFILLTSYFVKYFFHQIDKSVLQNSMTLYLLGILLHCVTMSISFLYSYFRNRV
jgi:predicted membrane-bound mannosyltransferase